MLLLLLWCSEDKMSSSCARFFLLYLRDLLFLSCCLCDDFNVNFFLFNVYAGQIRQKFLRHKQFRLWLVVVHIHAGKCKVFVFSQISISVVWMRTIFICVIRLVLFDAWLICYVLCLIQGLKLSMINTHTHRERESEIGQSLLLLNIRAWHWLYVMFQLFQMNREIKQKIQHKRVDVYCSRICADRILICTFHAHI